ncbi:MAG: nuclear transport factor 2 family protein [Bacteroidota bacterium]
MKTLYLILILVMIGCSPKEEMNPVAVVREVRAMFDDYESSVERDGLMAEFAYLDSSEEFFWVPPGFTSALSYDSVRTIVTQNASQMRSITLAWDTLKITPLSRTAAVYTGILRWTVEGTSGTKTPATLIETGVVVRRHDGWKLLCGQSRNLGQN